MLKIEFTADSPEEYREILKLLAGGNVAAASAYEAPVTVPQAPVAAAKRAPAATAQQAPITAQPEEAVSAPERPASEPQAEGSKVVALTDLQAAGRKLAAAGKGAEVQRILAAHGAKLMSRIPEADRAAVLAELEAVPV